MFIIQSLKPTYAYKFSSGRKPHGFEMNCTIIGYVCTPHTPVCTAAAQTYNNKKLDVKK